MANIYQKMLEVMKAIEYLNKDDHVKYRETNYKAKSEEKVTSTVRKELIKQGLVVFPIKQDDRQWSGNEYLQLYPSIEYFDGTTTYNTGETIPKGYYVYYHYENRITSLERWISK